MFGKQQTQDCRIAPRKPGRWISGLLLAVNLVASAQAASLDSEIDHLSAEVVGHSDGVKAVEQAVLPLTDTRVAVFLSLGDRQALELDSVELYLDGEPVSSHLYNDRERESLGQGDVHQIYTGNLAAGSHQLKVVVNARADNNRFVRREISHPFRKQSDRVGLKMALDARAPEFEPDVSFFSVSASEFTKLADGVKQFVSAAEPGDKAVQRKGYGDARQQEKFRLAERERLQGRTDAAGRHLAAMDEGYWAALGYMNLAGDFARDDLNPSRALVSLRVAMAMAAKDTNTARSKNLLNQLHLRAGYLALTNEEYDKAVDFLEKVTLDSYYAPHALYLHGLALAEKDNHRAAMQSWHRAKKFPLAFPGVSDAWIGMGRGYDLAGYPGQAGESWLAANAAYQGERVTLNKLAERIREDGAYKALVEDARGPDTQWFLADSRTLTQPRMAYLFLFLEQPPAQAAVRRVAMLDNMATTLVNNDHNLSVFIDALNNLKAGNPSSASIPRKINPQLAEARKLKSLAGQLLAKVHEARAVAAKALDELALAFVAGEDRRMAHAVDRTEQQIAHLYEYLALENLGEGAQ